MQTDRNQEKELLKTLLENLAGLKETPPKFKDLGLTAFCASEGENARGGLMVLGRAVNGWEDKPWKIENLRNEGKIRGIIDGLYNFTSTKWVMDCRIHPEKYNNYPITRSAFWRVIESVTKKLIPETTDENWTDYIAYSNLYKVSPYCGGNPSNRLAEIQRKDCINLLKQEITQWQPERILFLTGLNWADKFLIENGKGLGEITVRTKNFEDRLVQMTGDLTIPQGTPIPFVVASHPQGKPETLLTQEILRSFGC